MLTPLKNSRPVSQKALHVTRMPCVPGLPICLLLIVGCNQLDVDTADWPAKKIESGGVSPTETQDVSGITFVKIPAGSFVMGAVSGEPVDEYSRCEFPAHKVTITRNFFLARHEISVGQFRKFVESTEYVTEAEHSERGANSLNLQTGAVQQLPETVWHDPGFPQTDDHPVVCVSWNDANAFCGWMSQTNKATFRLPTEAEWEYACRAGTQTKYFTGSDAASLRGHANFRDASLQGVFPIAKAVAPWSDGSAFTSAVGRFSANAFGLHDMHGNVGEWCQDWYSSEYYAASPATDPTGPPQPTAWRAVKGGSWYNSANSCRCSGRHDGIETAASTTNGFRVCLIGQVSR